MDKSTTERLKRIGASIPRHLLRNLMVKEGLPVDMERIQKHMASLPEEDRKAAQNILDNAKTMSKDIVDPNIQKKIDEHLKRTIDREMARGAIKKAERDRFMKKMGV